MNGKVTFDFKNMIFSAEGDDSFILEQENRFIELQKEFLHFDPQLPSLPQPTQNNDQQVDVIETQASKTFSSSLCEMFGCSSDKLNRIVDVDEANSSATIVVPREKTYFSSVAKQQIGYALLNMAVADAKGEKLSSSQLQKMVSSSGIDMTNYAHTIDRNAGKLFVETSKDKEAQFVLTQSGRQYIRDIVARVINADDNR
jgi:hypothetical protein